MLTEHRKRAILEELRQTGQIVAKELSERLNLSEDTIRRDLRQLAAEGLLLRVHGGALPASPATNDLATRRNLSVNEKVKLGRAGAKLLSSVASAFLDGGTTNLEVVKALPMDYEGAIYTHSPTIAAALEHHKSADVVLLGGKLFKHSMVAMGATTIQMLEALHVDLFLLGVTGIHAKEGLTTGDFEEAAIKRAIMARASEVAVLATRDKIGAASPHRIAGLDRLNTLVTTERKSSASLKRKGLTLVQV